VSVEFAAARPADLPQLVELLGLLFEQESEFAVDPVKQDNALKLIFADPTRGRIYAAREGKLVVAMASLLYTVSTAEGGKAAWFEDLVVRPEFRQRGIGAKLLEYVIAQARAEGIVRITLLTDMQNESAQVLYRRLGFTGSPMKPMRLKLKPPPK
jgi:ribosomal protein S18 acetylase RimI-like enzyme